MRIVHATDIHWTVPPPLGRLLSKRALGSLNQLLGRKKHFSEAAQAALVRKIVELAPDAVVITGDVTTMALEDEFQLAREALAPVLERFPALVLAGNHDRYTRRSMTSKRMECYFGDWMGSENLVSRLDVGDVTVLGLDPNRPHLLSSGLLPQAQLRRLAQLLASEDLAHRTLVLALHYPVLDRHGAVYNGLEHGLRNAQALLDVLEGAPLRPIAVLHGHIHHGYRVDRSLGGDQVAFLNAGSGGYAYMPKRRRAAALNLYDLGPHGLCVERFMYQGDVFAPEPGGAYATGR